LKSGLLQESCRLIAQKGKTWVGWPLSFTLSVFDSNQPYQFSLLVEGISRIRLQDFNQIAPYAIANIDWVEDDVDPTSVEIKALGLNLKVKPNVFICKTLESCLRSVVITLSGSCQKIVGCSQSAQCLCSCQDQGTCVCYLLLVFVVVSSEWAGVFGCNFEGYSRRPCRPSHIQPGLCLNQILFHELIFRDM
jgi:hypothetical protein